MKRFLFAALSICFSTAILAANGPKVQYSADTSMETEEVSSSGRIYFAPGKQRQEMNMGGQKTVTILRHDKKVVWMLMPEQKMYMETPMNSGNSNPGDLSGYKIEKTEIGPETINGINTTKHKVIMTDSDGNKMGGFMWLTADEILVKTDVISVNKGSKRRIKQELTNLKVGKQDSSLFEIPAGYNTMNMGAMMGNMMRERHR